MIIIGAIVLILLLPVIIFEWLYFSITGKRSFEI